MRKIPLFKCLVIACIAMLACNFVYAQQQNQAQITMQRQGWYGEATVGTGVFALALVTTFGTFTKAGSGGIGGTVALGYQFHPGGVALEGGLIRWYGEATETSNRAGPDKKQIQLQTTPTFSVPYLAVRWDLPVFNSKLSFIPKLGVMAPTLLSADYSKIENNVKYTYHEDGASLVLPLMGIGLGYNLSPHTNLALEYQGLMAGLVNVGFLSAGITFHF